MHTFVTRRIKMSNATMI